MRPDANVVLEISVRYTILAKSIAVHDKMEDICRIQI